MEKENKVVEKFAVGKIPDAHRQGWVPVAFVWIGSTITISGIVTGVTLAGQLPFWQALLAIFIGYGIIVGIAILQGIQGSDLGTPTVKNAEVVFGEKSGRKLFSIIVLISLVGWFGIQSSIAGESFSMMMSDYFGIAVSYEFATIFWGIVMLITAIYGFKMMKWLNYIAVPFMIITIGWSFIYVLQTSDLSTLLTYQPAEPQSIISGISIIVGGFIVGAVIAGDYTRYMKSRKDTVLAASIGIGPLGIFLKFVGIVLAVCAFSSDIVVVMAESLPVPAFALFTLILATWTTNVANAYSAGLAGVNAFNLKDDKRALVTLIIGIIGTILALNGILDKLNSFLVLLTNLVAPVAGVMITDYWIVCKGKVKNYNERQVPAWIGITAWASGSILGIIAVFPQLFPNISDLGSLILSLASLLGIVISGGVYIILHKKFANTEIKFEELLHEQQQAKAN